MIYTQGSDKQFHIDVAPGEVGKIRNNAWRSKKMC